MPRQPPLFSSGSFLKSRHSSTHPKNICGIPPMESHSVKVLQLIQRLLLTKNVCLPARVRDTERCKRRATGRCRWSQELIDQRELFSHPSFPTTAVWLWEVACTLWAAEFSPSECGSTIIQLTEILLWNLHLGNKCYFISSYPYNYIFI